jgi:hypothetical protein
MSAKVMRALRFAEFGPPSVLRLEEVPIPERSMGRVWAHPGEKSSTAYRRSDRAVGYGVRRASRDMAPHKDKNVSSAHILSEHKDRQERPTVQSVISAVNRRSLP